MIQEKQQVGQSSRGVKETYDTTTNQKVTVGSAVEINGLEHATIYFANQELVDVAKLQVGHTDILNLYGTNNFQYRTHTQDDATILKLKPKKGLEITVFGTEEMPGEKSLTLDASLTSDSVIEEVHKFDPAYVKVIHTDGTIAEYNNLPNVKIVYNK